MAANTHLGIAAFGVLIDLFDDTVADRGVRVTGLLTGDQIHLRQA